MMSQLHASPPPPPRRDDSRGRWRRLYAQLVFGPTLAWNMLLGRVLRIRNWWDRVDTYVLLGALPLPRDVPRLYELGVRAVVNTCEEYAGPVEMYRRYGIEQLRIPTIDFTHPSVDSIEQAVRFIDQHVRRQESVYVHCKAGRARSATIVLCWLVAAKGLSPAQAQRQLVQQRPHVNRHLPQRPVVQQFCRRAGVIEPSGPSESN